jgi:hypothetical protein
LPMRLKKCLNTIGVSFLFARGYQNFHKRTPSLTISHLRLSYCEESHNMS